MIPKEKAKELVIKKFGCSKKYALIAVDEIINIKGNLNFDYVWYEQRETDINNWLDTRNIVPIRMHALEYWNEVKNEIKKL